MSKNLIFFSSHLGQNVGGAEISSELIIKDLSSKFSVKLFSFRPQRKFILLPKLNNNIIYIRGFHFFRRPLPFFNYFLNRFFLLSFFKKQRSDVLITYGIYSPCVVLPSKAKKKIVYIRSLIELGFNFNYHQDCTNRLIKNILIRIDIPFKALFMRDLNAAFQSSSIIANSYFVKDLIRKHFGIHAKVELPIIDIGGIKLAPESSRKEIVFVGDSHWKGLHLVLKIASILHNYNFVIYSRKSISVNGRKNVFIKEWTIDKSEIFSKASLVIVPSQAIESYGRVSREAFLLKIPVLVSNIGGLPETVDYKKKYIVDEYQSVSAWEDRILKTLK